MKAKKYIFGDKLEIKFPTGEIFTPKKGEKPEAFEERVKGIAIDEFLEEEFEVVEITQEVVATNDDDQLQEALKTAEGLQKKLIEAVLKERGLIAEKPKREKIEKQSKEAMMASEHYKDCESKIGQHISFSPFKKTEVIQGEIRGVALNKTNTIVYFTVVDANGKRICCGAKNETIKYIAAPEKKADEKAKPAAKKATKKEAAGDDLV